MSIACYAQFPIKLWVTKPAHWIDRWCHPKKRNTYQNHDVIEQKPQAPNLKKFLILNYKPFWVLEGLNSSLAQFAAELWRTKICPERANHIFLGSFLFFSKIGFLSHNFGSRYATKPIKPSKEYPSFQINFKQKNGLLGWRLGPGKLGQKENMPPLWRQPQKTQTQNQKFLKNPN